jgi:hypothetical protein
MNCRAEAEVNRELMLLTLAIPGMPSAPFHSHPASLDVTDRQVRLAIPNPWGCQSVSVDGYLTLRRQGALHEASQVR